MKNYIKKLYKTYYNKPTEQNLSNFFGAAIHEYTKEVTGQDLCISHIGINNPEDFDKWLKTDIRFREWFKKEFNYWLKFEGDNLIMIDLRLEGLKLYNNQKLEPERKFAEPRDVDKLNPEI